MARILVIDDDKTVAKAIRIVLELEGFEVSVVHDGRSGIERVTSEPFDLLMVDVFMPGMDGLETIRLVRERRPQLPILVMSGLSFRSGPAAAPDFLAMATKLGAIRSLKKPFRPRELLAAIAESLEASTREAPQATPPGTLTSRTQGSGP